MKRVGFLLSISLFWLVLSVLSDGITTLLLPQRLLGQEIGQNQATVLGLLSFAGILAGMLIQPFAGAVSDRLRPRWGRKSVLTGGTLLTLLALGVFAIPLGLAGPAAGYVLVQVGLSVAQAAQQGFIPDQVPPAERGKASGLKNFMDIGGSMLGFLVLGQLLGGGKYLPALAWMVGMMAVGLALTALLVREPRQAAAAISHPRSDRLSPVRLDIHSHITFVWLVTARFFFLFGIFAVGRFLLLFIASRLGLSAENASAAAGNVLAGLSLITVAAAPAAGWAADRFGRKPLMLWGAIFGAAGAAGYLFAASLGQIFLSGSLLSLGSAAFASANWAMTADVVPKQEAARFFGIANFGTAGAAAAAGLLGPLVDIFNRAESGRGYTALFAAAACSFLFSIACQQGLRKTGTLPVTPPADGAGMVVDSHKGLDT